MKKSCVVVGIVLALLIIGVSLLLTLGGRTPMLGEKVGLVRVEGVILDARTIVKKLKKYRKSASVKAVVLRVNSPGGGVAPAQEIYNEVKKLVAEKPVVVSMGSLAASGGYYISVPANWIMANPGTMTGSIGVIMEIPNIAGLMEKIGIDNQVVKSGERKDIASMFRSLEPGEREILQEVLDDVHEQFIEAVSAGRGIDVDTVRPMADGRIFTGRQAKNLGLIDELGDLEDAILEAGKLAEIDGEPQVVGEEDEHSWKDLIRGMIGGTALRQLLTDGGPSVRYEYRP